MSTVVQATCPGCKQRLHVPADWLTQAVRCKKCGLVLQTRESARASAARPAVSARTPPPAARPAPAAPVAVTAAQAVPVAPVAVTPAVAGDPFAQLDADDAAPVRRSRYRRRGTGGWWKGPAVALGVLVVAAVGVVLAWPYIRDAIQVQPQTVAQTPKNDIPGDSPNPGVTDTPKPADTSPKPGALKPADTGTKPNDPNGKPKESGKPPPAEVAGRNFPNRRALVISVHNYLYANPVHAGLPTPGGRNIPNFLDALNKGLHIPMTEMAHLSDAAKDPHTPMKPVIEKTLTDFLDTSRAQDRILVFFVGHAVAIDGEAYLVPIEGELDKADALIPLKWVYEQMAKCKARQKVLVADVNRLNPGHGLERPNGGPMDPKVDAALNAPPEGVQVWTACVAGQQSYELDDAQMGVFLDELNTALAPAKGEKGMEGKIQHPEDPLPLEALRDLVNASMKETLANYKLKQESRLAGEEPKEGAAYSKEEPPAPIPALAVAPAAGDPKLVQAVLDEVGVPPIKASKEESGLRIEALPPFPADKMAPYLLGAGAVTDDQKKLRDDVEKAREVMWALNTAPPPAALKDAVAKIRGDLKADLSVLQGGFRKPSDEAKFKDSIFKQERNIADMLDACSTALDDLKAAKELRDKEPSKRWQVNYDFTLARLEAQYAYLMEYQSVLGQMRKQMPDLAPGQDGWKLASLEKPKGDSAGKNAEKASRKLLEQIIADNPGTPWEVLAKREKLTALGLQWQGAKIE